MNDANIEVRPVRENELDIVAGIYKEAFIASGFEEKWTDESAKKKVDFLYKLQPDLFLIAVCDGQIAGGIASVVKPWWTKPYISDLDIFIDLNFQAKGIGKILLKRHLEEAIEKYGIESVETSAALKTEFPLSWYKRIGFQPITKAVYIEGKAEEILKKIK